MNINNKKPLAVLISSILMASTASFSSSSLAQGAQTDEVEVIQVRGIRGSVVKSINAKRYANSIVDAVSSEDIGKFPDQNVAESLQRITGVAIDRNNGEGSKITVRGMGPQFNTVDVNT